MRGGGLPLYRNKRGAMFHLVPWYISTMTDDEFLSALEACALPADEFGHAAHVRAAYLYLREAGWDAALDNIRRSLQRYVAHLGKADRYDDALTRAYMRLIQRRMAECGQAGEWAAFANANRDLLDKRR